MPRRPPAPVRYGSGDQKLLSLVLWQAWGSCCYWCTRPKLAHEVHIDHLIPQATPAADLPGLIRLHNLPAGFDLDEPANLATICPPCNTEKSNRDFSGTGLMTSKLDLARGKAPDVIRQVRAHRGANAVARDLIRVAGADLLDPDTRRAFVRHAPAIVQSLALIDESKTDFLTPRDFTHQIGTFCMPVELSLGTRGRAAESTIATVFGCLLPDALDDGLSQIAALVDTEIAAEVERFRGETGDIGPISTDLLSARLHFAGLARRGGRLTARFTGALHGEYNASVVDTNQWGDGLTEHSVIVYAEASFTLAVSWALTDGPGLPGRTRARITEGNVDADLA